jgi:putative membrane protein
MTQKDKDLEGEPKKDLILREYLAIERTKMANQRTLLSFLRTGLYFLVAGTTLGQLIENSIWKFLGMPFTVIGIAITAIGLFVYLKGKRSILESRKQIGRVKDDFILSIVGTHNSKTKAK